MAIKIKISNLMGEKKMNMSELADLTGIQNNTISNLYHEKSKRISFEQMDALCKALDCDVSDIFEYIED